RSPCRTIAWSSTRTMLVTPSGPGSCVTCPGTAAGASAAARAAVALPPVIRCHSVSISALYRQRYAHPHRDAAQPGAADRQRPAELLGAGLHVDESSV